MDSEMIFIQESTFVYRVVHRIMEGDCACDHGPVIKRMPAFLISKYPVTNAEYADFVKESGYRPVDSHNFLKDFENGCPKPGTEKKPVTWISHRDAEAYAAWMGGRLPHDWEWQYAAAGPEGNKYPWGNLPDKTKCNVNGENLTDVDRYPEGASSFGLMDLCGNAREWTEDILDDGMHLFTLLRGGCYYQAPHFWHADGGMMKTNQHQKFQLLADSQDRCGTISFRVVREADK